MNTWRTIIFLATEFAVWSSSDREAELSVGAYVALSGVVSGERFRYLRHVVRYRQPDIARLFGVSVGTISRWENDERVVSRAAWLVLGQLVLDEARVRYSPEQQAIACQRPVPWPANVILICPESDGFQTTTPPATCAVCGTIDNGGNGRWACHFDTDCTPVCKGKCWHIYSAKKAQATAEQVLLGAFALWDTEVIGADGSRSAA